MTDRTQSSSQQTSDTQRIAAAGDANRIDKRVAMLGAGKMGSILIEGFIRSGRFTPDQIAATVQHDNRATAHA